MRLLADYPADGEPAMEKARAQNWIDALEGLPAWALEAARLKWVRGQVEGANPDFAPKPPRFREIVTSCMSPVYERKSRMTLLLRAEPEVEGDLPPERRAELADVLTKLSNEISRGGDPLDRAWRKKRRKPSPEVVQRAARIALIRYAKQNRAAPPKLSEAMRAKLASEGHLAHPAPQAA